MTRAITEAAAQELQEFREAFIIAVGDKSPFAKQALLRADTAIVAIPLIEVAALERAAQVAEEYPEYPGEVGMGDRIAAAIRAMKPAESSAA